MRSGQEFRIDVSAVRYYPRSRVKWAPLVRAFFPRMFRVGVRGSRARVQAANTPANQSDVNLRINIRQAGKDFDTPIRLSPTQSIH